MTTEYIISKGPETLKKTDYCYDCDGLITAGEQIYIIRFGNLPNNWAKVHPDCAKKSPHWGAWELEETNRLITAANTKIPTTSSPLKYNLVVLAKGDYVSNKKYSVIKIENGQELYRTSREERAQGVLEFLNGLEESLLNLI